jgi:hypothetical protein
VQAPWFCVDGCLLAALFANVYWIGVGSELHCVSLLPSLQGVQKRSIVLAVCIGLRRLEGEESAALWMDRKFDRKWDRKAATSPPFSG